MIPCCSCKRMQLQHSAQMAHVPVVSMITGPLVCFDYEKQQVATAACDQVSHPDGC